MHFILLTLKKFECIPIYIKIFITSKCYEIIERWDEINKQDIHL